MKNCKSQDMAYCDECSRYDDCDESCSCQCLDDCGHCPECNEYLTKKYDVKGTNRYDEKQFSYFVCMECGYEI